MNDNEKYHEMIRLYQLGNCEEEVLDLASGLMKSDLPTSKMKDVERIYSASLPKTVQMGSISVPAGIAGALKSLNAFNSALKKAGMRGLDS